MKKYIFLILSFCCFANNIFSQTKEELKTEAIEKFEQEDYSFAVELLEKALEKNTTDKEIYYYLGHFNHYRAYDSRSANFDRNYYEKIYYYLDKALELDPNYGDARYFYGVQCGADAIYSLQNGDTIKALNYCLKAYEKNCFAPWLLEYGVNVLNSCEKNAILFCNGDAEVNTLTYLQLIKKVRTDITVIPLGFLDRLWYVLLLKNGLGQFIKKTDINLSDNGILNLHLFKWKENKIEIGLNQDYKKKYNLKENFFIEIYPDIISISNQNRTYLNVGTSVLLNIIEANINNRPIFFTNRDVFTNYLESYGIVFKLLPFKTEGTSFESNFIEMENLLKNENFVNYKTIITTNQPYISPILFRYHYYCWSSLMLHYLKINDNKKVNFLFDFINNNLMTGCDFDKPLKGFLEQFNTDK
ncbi:MAG: hypothetical protein LBT27_01340 [Prevotellaceae bacterium]|jgi:tetratricopeptide (TPR) repeat protein|nr:hypothetical protein [Prevotellaceae bacterium]